jgi:hypothetical protein
VACLSRFFILILNFQPGARFEADQGGSNIVFVDAENQRLMVTVVVGIADGQKMFSFLTEQKDRRDGDGEQQTAIDFLAVFEGLDAGIRNADLGFPGVKGEITRVGNFEGAGGAAFDGGGQCLLYIRRGFEPAARSKKN